MKKGCGLIPPLKSESVRWNRNPETDYRLSENPGSQSNWGQNKKLHIKKYWQQLLKTTFKDDIRYRSSRFLADILLRRNELHRL